MVQLSRREFVAAGIAASVLGGVRPLQANDWESIIRVDDLRCESAIDPLGIDTLHPRLSWRLYSNERGQKQTAYQIMVASSKSLLERGEADIWDSGKVISAQSNQVTYRGPSLSSRQRCFWKVRVWDKDGEPSPHSRDAFWEMALLSQEDWKSEWIGYAPGWAGRALYFRSDVAVNKAITRARIYISGLGYYELRVNGAKIGDRVLDPGVTDYRKRILYATYDVSSQLVEGKNVIGVIVGNGWYGEPKLLLQLEITYLDGSTEIFGTGASSSSRNGIWRVTSGPIRENSIYDGELYDARLEKTGWDLPMHSLSTVSLPRSEGWTGPQVESAPGGRMESETINPIAIVASIRPVSVSEPKPNIFVFDIGQNIAGWAQLRVSGSAGTRVTLRFAEYLADDGTVDQTNLRRAAATDTYILNGRGNETWEPRFTYHGFRYVQIEGFPGKPAADNITARVVRSSVAESGKIETSNELINDIQKMVWWTESSNLHSIPTDCPQRDERLGWMNDLTVRIEEAVYNFDMSRFYPKFLKDVCDTQTENGAISDTAPYRWGHHPADPVSASYLLLGWTLYQHYGDERSMAESYEGFASWVNFLHKNSNDNIVNYGYYGDWSPPKAFAISTSIGAGAVSRVTPVEFMSTGYLFYCAQLLSEMARILGKQEDEKKYKTLANEVAAAFNLKYWNDTAGGYVNSDNESTNSFALYSGLVPEGKVRQTIDSLVSAVHANHDHLSTGNLCTKYLLEALTRYGHGDLAYKIATQETYPGWGFMLKNNATTLWERWELLTGHGMNSHNHPMMGSVSSWIHKYLGGITCDPDGPGFKQIVIRPYLLGDLRWVRASYPSPYGTIASAWKKVSDHFEFDVTVPVNTTATVYLPAKALGQITEGGRPAASADGVKVKGNADGVVIFEVSSGSYHFVVQG